MFFAGATSLAPLGSPLSHCPFCNGSVDTSLVVYGGTCPHCFGEIPGEETPTDPGEAVKAQMLEADRQHARRRTLAPLFALAPVVLAVVVGSAWYVVQANATLEPIVFEDDFFAGLEFEFQEYSEPEQAEPVAQVADARAAGVTKGSRRLEASLEGSGGGLVGDQRASDQLAGGGQAGGTASGLRSRTATAGPRELEPSGGLALKTGSDHAGVGVDLSFNTRRTAAVLETPDDIRGAIRDLFRMKGPRLRQCYERRLKADEGLRGQWKLEFTIGVDGLVSGPSATGVQRQDPELESCLVKEVSGWSIYGRLPKPQPVSLPLNFDT